jgi:hypothetical protein
MFLNIYALGLVTIIFCSTAIFGEDEIVAGNLTLRILLGVSGSFLCLLLISLSLQPVSRVKLTFRVS